MLDQWQTILILKGTAGNISLIGKLDSHGIWSYYRSVDYASSNQVPEVVQTWHEALGLLGQSWKYLKPQYVHPQFKAQLWRSISTEKGMFDRSLWRKYCM